MAAAATVSEKTKAAKNLQNQKKTSSKYRANESRVELAQTMPSAADIMQHRTDGTDAFDTLYIGAENFRTGKVMLSRQREFCSVAVNGEALASGLAVLVGEAGERSLASKTHRKNFLTEMLSA